jgi:hypothetical protein
MRFSQGHLLGALLPLLPFSAAAPAEPVRVPRHATVVGRQAVSGNYTFIIAGGGIAGLTLADRLTEDPNGTYQHARTVNVAGCFLVHVLLTRHPLPK